MLNLQQPIGLGGSEPHKVVLPGCNEKMFSEQYADPGLITATAFSH